MFSKLKKLQQQQKNCKVSRSAASKQLYNWLTNQKVAKNLWLGKQAKR